MQHVAGYGKGFSFATAAADAGASAARMGGVRCLRRACRSVAADGKGGRKNWPCEAGVHMLTMPWRRLLGQ